MVIDLTNSEKTTFFRFLGLYLGSSFILLSLIAFFYYQNEKILYLDLTKSNMQNITSKLSSKIIIAHMTNSKFDKSSLLKTDKYRLSFYNEKKEKTFGNLDEKIDFSKTLIQKENSFILVNDSTLGHLGIYYIALKENMFFKRLKQLQLNIILLFFCLYSIIALIGFYLAKLFLKPIKEERVKLNNFIKDTTHELNTPISALLMSTESESLTSKQIERVRLSARKISEIYKDLTYIFLENTQQKKIVETVRLDELIKEQLNYFEPLALKKQIKITSNLEEYYFSIAIDDFERLINNIISNAIKYNKIGGEIYIELIDGVLSIKDTGIGIRENKLNDIFKRYFRATNEKGGFGIGLNIVKHISQIYNIKIDVQSKQGKGTTFFFSF